MTSVLILCARGQSVAPDRGALDADAQGVSAIFGSDAWTIALAAQRRAYDWSFFASHEDPARVFQPRARG